MFMLFAEGPIYYSQRLYSYQYIFTVFITFVAFLPVYVYILYIICDALSAAGFLTCLIQRYQIEIFLSIIKYKRGNRRV